MQGSKPQKPRVKHANVNARGTATKRGGQPDEQGWDGRKQMRSSKNLGFGSVK